MFAQFRLERVVCDGGFWGTCARLAGSLVAMQATRPAPLTDPLISFPVRAGSLAFTQVSWRLGT